MPKFTAKIEKYEENNIWFVGKKHPLFISPMDIKEAMKNYPPGTVVTAGTKPKEKGSLEGMALPTPAELRSYEQDQKAREGMQDFKPASTLPRDPDKKDSKAILQDNLDALKAEHAKTDAALAQINRENQQGTDRIAENTKEIDNLMKKETSPADPPAKPACFKPALCPKACDGTKDPCQFKPKAPAKQPAEPSQTAPVGKSPEKQTSVPVNPKEALKQSQAREMFESILNADPQVIDYIAEHDTDLWEAFLEKVMGIIPEKKPAELKLPSESELVAMTLNYDSYWKSKTLADIITRHDIRKQVDIKNRIECVNSAIALLNGGDHRPDETDVLTSAKTLYAGIMTDW